MDQSDLFEEFVRRLNGFDSRATAAPDGEWIEIGRWEGADLDPPVRLLVNPPVLEDHLRLLADDGAEVFPGVHPLIGAMQLLLVHVEEEIAMRGAGEVRLVIRDGALRLLRDEL